MRNCESLELVWTWHQQHGRTFETSLGRTVLGTIEPKNVQAVLALKFKDFDLGNRNKALAPLLGQGIFASDGPIWEHSRALVRPNFVRNQISDMGIYERHVSNLIANIPHDGSKVDLQKLFFQMVRPKSRPCWGSCKADHSNQTIDSATEFLFGESIESLDAGDDQPAFAKDFNTSQDGLAIRTRLGPLMFLYQNREFSKATTEARAFVDRFVDAALEYRAARADSKDTSKASDERYVFLYELSKQTADKKMLTDQVLNILLAGRDTTASLLSITCFILARRPKIWERLREEVLELDKEIPSFEDLKSMAYLSWILNESKSSNISCTMPD